MRLANDVPSKRVISACQHVFLAAMVALSGAAMIAVAEPSAYATFLWPPTGIALGAFLTLGSRSVPAVLIGMLLGYLTPVFYGQLADGPLWGGVCAFGVSSSATALAWTTSRLIKLVRRQPTAAKALPFTKAFLGIAGLALLFSLVSALIVAATGVNTTDGITQTWLLFFTGNAVGALVFTPVFLSLVGAYRQIRSEYVSPRISHFLMIFILIFSVGATLMSWKSVSIRADQRDQSRFDALAAESESALQFKMKSYEQSLLAGVGLFSTLSQVSSHDWRHYVDVIQIRTQFPGINGIGYIANVRDEDLVAFLEQTKADGAPDFTVKPEGDHPANFIITFIEPLDINLPAQGLNIAFEENRREAAITAMETGRSTITKRILLVQDSEKTPGFLLLLPIYKADAPVATPGQRRDATLGWIYAPFIGKNFLQNLTLSQGDSIHIEVFDGAVASPETLIYTSLATGDTASEPLFTRTRQIEVMQQTWTLVWKSSARFESLSNDPLSKLILLGGAALTGLLAFIFLMTVRQNGLVQEEVALKTRKVVEARRSLQAVLDTVVDGIVSISPVGQIRGFNPAAERIFGYRAGEVIGQNVNILMPEPYRSEHDGYLHTFFKKVGAKPIAAGRTVTAQRKDGSIFPMELFVNEIGLSSERGFVGSIRDITERITARNALEASEQTFRQAMELASIGMVLVCPAGACLRVNKAFCDVLGYDEGELLGSTIRELTHPDDLIKDLALMDDLVAGRISSYRLEKRFISKTRNVVWTKVSVSIVRKPDGTPDYTIKQVEDISDRREMDRLKSEFVSTVSHELRTPLTSIRGSLGLVVGAMSSALPQNILDLIKIAHKNSERLIALVNDILDIDKLDSGEMHFEISHQKLGPIVAQAMEANRPFADTHGVTLQVQQCESDAEVMVDSLRLMQVLTNLISNAAKFSPAGSQVVVSTEVVEKKVWIRVRDQGIGISDNFKSRIFSKFAQADASPTRQKGGTGLGLLISKRLVERMAGEIGFESIFGQGTTFWVSFPLAAPTGFEPTEPEFEIEMQ